jgi:hypothetical protein
VCQDWQHRDARRRCARGTAQGESHSNPVEIHRQIRQGARQIAFLRLGAPFATRKSNSQLKIRVGRGSLVCDLAMPGRGTARPEKKGSRLRAQLGVGGTGGQSREHSLDRGGVGERNPMASPPPTQARARGGRGEGTATLRASRPGGGRRPRPALLLQGRPARQRLRGARRQPPRVARAARAARLRPRRPPPLRAAVLGRRGRARRRPRARRPRARRHLAVRLPQQRRRLPLSLRV